MHIFTSCIIMQVCHFFFHIKSPLELDEDNIVTLVSEVPKQWAFPLVCCEVGETVGIRVLTYVEEQLLFYSEACLLLWEQICNHKIVLPT